VAEVPSGGEKVSGMDTTGSMETTLPAQPAPSPAQTGTPWRVRPAVPDDVEQIDALVRELATYEREPDSVKATVDDFRAALFGSNPRVHCHVAEISAPTGPKVVGMALWFVSFSTWRGRHGIWLEDLFVQPEHRRLGLGRALLEALAQICVERGYRRLEWWVLDWNTPAQDFYRSIGAEPQPDWTTWRVDEAALTRLGTSSS
jgi:GNAT superfamily N-acetyltransferase